MTSNQLPQPKDYSLLLDSNFDVLNNRPSFNAKLLLDNNHDWYLMEFLNEMELMGSSNEQTLNALLTMIGSLSNNTYCRNLLTGSPVWLNVFSHVIGTTGSNKSYLANEMIYALKTLNDKFPGVYSNRQNSDDIDSLEEQPRKKLKTEPWNSLASSITEAALSKTTNHTDVTIVNPDGDNALKLLSYYEQNTTCGAQGVSLFCTGYDGIEPGSSRVTGVESSTNNRQRPSKLSMYVVSTGKKLSLPLMKMVEEGANDGVYGRVWYTHTNTFRELPTIITQRQISLPNFTHIALCCHYFFQNRTIEFRYGLFRSDFDSTSRSHISSRMQAARREQNVNLPEYYGISMDECDIVQQQHPDEYVKKDDSPKQFSPFELASQFTNEIWNESFTLEKHIGQMWRKISYHLPKAAVTMKILRLFFRIMGDQMLYYLNAQEGSRSYPAKSIDDTFHRRLNQMINEYFEQYSRTIEIQNKNIHVLLLTSDDVETASKWCRWKLETTYHLFSISQIKNIINSRLGKTPMQDSSSTKTIAEQRMDSAMVKVLMTPTIFFSNSYLSANPSRGGSGLFMQKRSTDLKYDGVVENLLAKGFLVKCNAIQGAHIPKNKNLSPSYFKQQPSYFVQSEMRMKELQDMGINFIQYKRNYENSSLPKNMFFNNNGIDLIKGDEWIPFYHTFLNDPMAQLLIEHRLKVNEIIEFDGHFGLNNSNMDVIGPSGENESTSESNKEQIEENFDGRVVNSSVFPDQLNLLPERLFRTQPNSTTDGLRMESQSFRNDKRTKPSFDEENVTNISHQADNFQPPFHSTPIDPNDELPSVPSIPDNHEALPSCQHTDKENMILSSVMNNGCLLSPINQSRSVQSMSTASPCSMQPVSSNSINKIIELLDSSSIELGLTNQIHVVQEQWNRRNVQQQPDDMVIDVVQDMVDVVCGEFITAVDAQLNSLPAIKKRGRPSLSKPTGRPSITALEINNVAENDNHPIWKKLILNKHVLASMSDLSRRVTGSDEINAARLTCIEKLLDIGCFLNGDEFLNGKERAVLKNSPEDPRLLLALNKYGIDMDEYKQSFNNQTPFAYKNGVPIPAVLDISTNKNKFTSKFVDKLQSDPFFSVYLRIDPEHVVKASSSKRKTTSSHETDIFRAQKQRKTNETKRNVGKKI